MTELVIPTPDRTPIPVGWVREVFYPAACEAAWGELDEAEARIRAILSYAESYDLDATELLKALRVIEYRRGVLAGDPGQGARTDLQLRQYAAEVDDASPRTVRNWRAIARHWPWLEDRVLDATGKVTQTLVLRWITEHTPARPDLDLPDVEANEMVSLLHGDFRDRLTALEPGSVDLIVTDPPYPKEDLPLWHDLGEIAGKLLAPRGILFAWSGQLFLPEVIRLVEAAGMTYGWTFALQLPGSGSRILGRHIIQAWKPVLGFSTGTWPSGEWGDDWLISPEPVKTDYEWQQNGAPAQRLIERYCPPGGLVVDPFMGIGTFGQAARAVGRRFVGVELDARRFQTAQENLI